MELDSVIRQHFVTLNNYIIDIDTSTLPDRVLKIREIRRSSLLIFKNDHSS